MKMTLSLWLSAHEEGNQNEAYSTLKIGVAGGNVSRNIISA